MERMTAEEMSQMFHTRAANSVYSDTVSAVAQMLKDYAAEEVEATTEELREAIYQLAWDMGASRCLALHCKPEDPEEPPCPWIPIAKLLLKHTP